MFLSRFIRDVEIAALRHSLALKEGIKRRQERREETPILDVYKRQEQQHRKNLVSSEASGLYRKIYMSKQMLAKRNPDIVEYLESFEKFKSQSKQWKADVKAGTKTEEEFIEWLKSVKEKKVL